MRVLVTGGAGFIGSAVVRYLVRDVGVQVLTLDKLTYAGNLESLRHVKECQNHRFIRADICDRGVVNQIFDDFRPEIVMHLAAESHVDRSITGSAAFIETNIVGTHVMLEAARDYFGRLDSSKRAAFRFLHVSTDEVYGSLGDQGLFTEDTPYDPSSPYSASKAAADHLAIAWTRTYGLPVIVSNCSNNYGPYHFPEKLIPLIILNALEGKDLPVYGKGANVRDWLYVDDHARALWLIATRGRLGEKYNVGGKNERANIEVVNTICKILDEILPKPISYANQIKFVADRPGHDQRYAIDATKLTTELGWIAIETFDSGLKKTIQWFIENEWWWRPLRHKVYDGQRLGVVSDVSAT